MPEVANGDLLEVLREEYDNLTVGIRQWLRVNDQILTAVFALIGTVTAIAFSQEAWEIVVAVPLVVFFVLVYTVRVAAEMVAMGAYRSAIEQRIAGLIGDDILIWEHKITKLLLKSPTVRVPHAMYSVAYIGSVGLGWWALEALEPSQAVQRIVAVAYVAMTGVLVWLAMSLRSIPTKVSKIAFPKADISKPAVPESSEEPPTEAV